MGWRARRPMLFTQSPDHPSHCGVIGSINDIHNIIRNRNIIRINNINNNNKIILLAIIITKNRNNIGEHNKQ